MTITILKDISRALICTAVVTAGVSGCATSSMSHAVVGLSTTDFRAAYGEPDLVIALNDGSQRWFVKVRPSHVQIAAGRMQAMSPNDGGENFVALVGSEQKILSFAPALSVQALAEASPGVWTKTTLIEHFGNPKNVSVIQASGGIELTYSAHVMSRMPQDVMFDCDSNRVLTGQHFSSKASPAVKPGAGHHG